MLVVPSQFVRSIITQIRPDIPVKTPIVICSKGIENDSLMTMDQVLVDELPGKYHPYISVLSGPSFGLEVAKRMPTNVTVASHNSEVIKRVQEMAATRYFRIYGSDDVTGVELGGALKNVIAIAAGGCEGLGF